jgi:hypothetical protein
MQQVFADANERVEQWPAWKKQIESRDSESEIFAESQKEPTKISEREREHS